MESRWGPGLGSGPWVGVWVLGRGPGSQMGSKWGSGSQTGVWVLGGGLGAGLGSGSWVGV